MQSHTHTTAATTTTASSSVASRPLCPAAAVSVPAASQTQRTYRFDHPAGEKPVPAFPKPSIPARPASGRRAPPTRPRIQRSYTIAHSEGEKPYPAALLKFAPSTPVRASAARTRVPPSRPRIPRSFYVCHEARAALPTSGKGPMPRYVPIFENCEPWSPAKLAHVRRF
ncbi:hypothetical protein BOTBODRAFT_181043 [Botryobasidium botryosum FD-172 SS1]|uniref:Uncharacterized protein n=1 Tax=Botryobasidium botryosum (strain FD-172 SS1) TaxID=930990 RepID=A0A067LUQ1_BOTB1|nr:hypothetical protein BOTBODRAFT_181043 [Botryobasidium botryosum FD-172 SS1]